MRPIRAALCLLSFTGCFEHHLAVDLASDSGDRDSGAPLPVDAALLVDAAPLPVDAALLVDAGLAVDAGPRCDVALEWSLVCASQRPFDEVRSFEVHTSVPDCDFGETCSTRLVAPPTDGGPGRLEVSLRACAARDTTCRPGSRFARLECSLPPDAPGGRYVVGGAGAPVEISLAPHGTTSTVRTSCHAPGSVGGGLCEELGVSGSFGAEEICIPRTARVGSVVYAELRSDCASCALEPGACTMTSTGTRIPSLTVSARARACDEGAPTWGCVGECSPLTIGCGFTAMPDVPQRVFYEGVEVGIIEPLPADAPFTEFEWVCARRP